ncbi:MAG: hypothetical protein RSE21_05455 [Bacilli bacterium]
MSKFELIFAIFAVVVVVFVIIKMTSHLLSKNTNEKDIVKASKERTKDKQDTSEK